MKNANNTIPTKYKHTDGTQTKFHPLSGGSAAAYYARKDKHARSRGVYGRAIETGEFTPETWEVVADLVRRITSRCAGRGFTMGCQLVIDGKTVNVRGSRELGYANHSLTAHTLPQTGESLKTSELSEDTLVSVVEFLQNPENRGVAPRIQGMIANADRRWNRGSAYPIRMVWRYSTQTGEYHRICGEKARIPGVSAIRRANEQAAKNGQPPAFVEVRIGVRSWGDAPPIEVAVGEEYASVNMPDIGDVWEVFAEYRKVASGKYASIVYDYLRGIRSAIIARNEGVHVQYVKNALAHFRTFAQANRDAE